MNAQIEHYETNHSDALIQTLWHTRLEQRVRDRQKRQLRTPLAIDFCSNDYLGMARHHDVGCNEHRFTQIAAQFSSAHGATGSRLLSGQAQIISTLESAIAEFHQTEAALLFNSGFDANLGTLAAIGDRHTVFLYDDLCELLERHAGKAIVIVVESVYSMDGDIAPLRELAELTKQYQAALVVDEAHSTAVFGEHGQGLTQQLGLHNDVTIRIHTYGKGMGCHGAAVVGSQTLIDYLINFARPFIYSTALPPSGYAAIARAYARLHENDAERARLSECIAAFKKHCAQYDWSKVGVRWCDSQTAIQGLIIGEVKRTHAVTQALHAQHLDVRPIFSPTVPTGTERLRICLHSFNTDTELQLLCDTLWSALSTEIPS